jgi:GNAT superfamily N-acetyltransferase
MLTLTQLTDSLPAGYQARPATLADVEATVAMFNAASQALLGRDEHTVAGWTREWQMPGFDLAHDSRLVLAPDGSVAAFACVWHMAPYITPETWGRVHPAHAGRGLGTGLLEWAEGRARQGLSAAPKEARVALRLWINSLDFETQALLRDYGCTLVRHNRRLLIDFGAPPPRPVWPAGVAVRSLVTGQDEREASRVVREAFRDSWGWVDEPFEERLARWKHSMQSDPDFDPSLHFLAVADGAIIGTSFASLRIDDGPELGWIHTLGVLRPWRRRGVALALLQHSFGALYERGRRRIGLGVDAASLTGATHLYEKAGMRPDPTHQFGTWEKELRSGKELSTTVCPP